MKGKNEGKNEKRSPKRFPTKRLDGAARKKSAVERIG